MLATVKSGSCGRIGYFGFAVLSSEEGKEWGTILVHRKSHNKYWKKRLCHQFNKDSIEVIMDNSVWDHFKGEVIGVISKEQLLDILREKYGYKISSEE